MLPREFPSPPQLVDLLRAHDKHRRNDYQPPGRPNANLDFVARHNSRVLAKEDSSTIKRAMPGAPTSRTTRFAPASLATEERAKLRQERSAFDGAHRLTHASWNSSTQLPLPPSRQLRHQILNKAYQPPAPVYVDISETNQLVDRLGKTTVSSRMKEYQQSAVSNIVNLHPGEVDDDAFDDAPCSPPDTRARDAIQTLLFYRREVEKRRQRAGASH